MLYMLVLLVSFLCGKSKESISTSLAYISLLTIYKSALMNLIATRLFKMLWVAFLAYSNRSKFFFHKLIPFYPISSIYILYYNIFTII